MKPDNYYDKQFEFKEKEKKSLNKILDEMIISKFKQDELSTIINELNSILSLKTANDKPI